MSRLVLVSLSQNDWEEIFVVHCRFGMIFIAFFTRFAGSGGQGDRETISRTGEQMNIFHATEDFRTSAIAIIQCRRNDDGGRKE